VTGSPALAIALALTTTTAFNGGLILEKRALSAMPPLNPREPLRTIACVLSSPAWLAGLALTLAGLGCQVTVLSIEPISIVQPVLASGIAVMLVLSRLVLRERLGPAESTCVAVMVVSLVLLALSQDATSGKATADPATLPALALVLPSLAAGLLIAAWPWLSGARLSGTRLSGTQTAARDAGTGGTSTALLTGVGVGLLYGVVSLATKGLSAVLAHHHAAAGLAAGILASPYLYLLGACSAVTMVLYQAALQACRAAILIPVTNVVSNAYFLIAGSWLFREPLPADPAKLDLRVAGIVAGGVVLVILSRRSSQPQPAEAGRGNRSHAVGAADGPVPFQLVASGRKSHHDKPRLMVFRSLPAWRGHWMAWHQRSSFPEQCPEPDLGRDMLIEVAGGATESGSIWVEVTSLVLRDGVLRVQAAQHVPLAQGRDIGSPYAAVITPAWDGPVALDLFEIHHDEEGSPLPARCLPSLDAD
jgi:drug/metabolite transporter (DMT)-like permease